MNNEPIVKPLFDIKDKPNRARIPSRYYLAILEALAWALCLDLLKRERKLERKGSS